MSKRISALLLTLLCLFFTSCATKEYTDSLPCDSVANKLTSKISGSEEYSAYTKSDIEYLFGKSSLFEDCAFLYSKSADDIGEVGVFRAESEEKAKEIFTEAEKYITDSQKEKRAFVENYLPDELDKLESAEVRRFGNYVILLFTDGDEKENLFDSAEELLKK